MKKFKKLLTVLLCATLVIVTELSLTACKSKTFYEFGEEKFASVFTDADLQDISYFYQGYVYKNDYIDYVPSKPAPVLDKKTEEQIIEDFKKWDKGSNSFKLTNFLGKYHSYYVVEIEVYDVLFDASAMPYIFYGYQFTRKHPAIIFIWG